MRSSQIKAGAEAFSQHYHSLFGERWKYLEPALSGTGSVSTLIVAKGCEPYFLDSSSVTAASFLPLPDTGEILDACAAPGGKTLVLASRLEPGATILANELSSERRRRLSQVLDKHLPPTLRSRVRVSGEDAGKMCLRNAGRFEAILLDVPCSSERHVLADPRALAEWTESRPRSLSRRQWTLLSSAWIMLRPGGWLLYSTCALDDRENQGVVERLVRKVGTNIEIDGPKGEGWEDRGFGSAVLPDRAAGAGPLYVARIRKSGAGSSGS